jgi:acetone carboxylase gamma subunit
MLGPLVCCLCSWSKCMIQRDTWQIHAFIVVREYIYGGMGDVEPKLSILTD